MTMNKTLYLECFSGISGDMTVAALIDLGVDTLKLQEALASLPLEGFTTSVSRVNKAGLDACDFNVVLDEENHDHDMEWLHGHSHDHDDDHGHEHEHHHHLFHRHHHHHHHHHNHEHHHEHRGLAEIEDILQRSGLSDRAKALAIKIFRVIASAESKAHGVPVEEVHFHEVGAVDSIVDIAALAFCVDFLGIDEVIVPVLYEGTGTVRCQHGILPIPVPAVAHIVEEHRLNLHMTQTPGEFVTPTGAAIVAALRTGDTLPEDFTILKTGLGAGKRNYERPSLLRAMLIEEKKVPAAVKESGAAGDGIVKLESNIDDCTGEQLGYVMEALFNAGARDVHYFPVFMKKNRPGYQLNVICTEDRKDDLLRIIFGQTSTIGVRILKMERAVLPREIRTVETSLGAVRVKTVTLPDGGKRSYPEYDDVAKLCRATGKPFPEVFHTVFSESNAQDGDR